MDQAIEWLCRAQDQTGCGGVAGFYHLFNGWSGPYAETTGYIVPTFLQAANQIGREDLVDRARAMLEWLLTTQLENGAFPGGIPGEGDSPEPRTFNTGQIIQGLTAGYQHYQDERYLIAAIRAAEWLCRIQDADGAWRQFAYNGTPHVYYSRVAWPLIEIGQVAKREAFIDAGRKNIEWVLNQQDNDGWFLHMEMVPGEPAVLHPIEYTLRGIWEAGRLLQDIRIENAAISAAEVLARHALTNRLTGAYRRGWEPASKWLCLTGNAQMTGLWLTMHNARNLPEMRKAAECTLAKLLRLQDLDNPCPELRGGLRGSYPVNGDYMPLSVINWGTKFLVDALLLSVSSAA